MLKPFQLLTHDIQKIGSITAYLEALVFIFGFTLYLTLLNQIQYGSLTVDPVESVALLQEHESLLYLWNLIIYVVFGILLVVLVLALRDRWRHQQTLLVPVATAFGLIWSGLVIASGMVANVGIRFVIELDGINPEQAAVVWLALSAVVSGLGGGNEIVGAVWIALISVAALRLEDLSKPLNYLGLIVGGAGVLTVIPPLSGLGAVFGLGSIVWFGGLGRSMGRRRSQ